MKVRIAGLINDSIVDGPGIRLTVFAQGCPHNCIGCHNPATHDMNKGRLEDVDYILKVADENPLLNGITLSGGEPFEQPDGMGEIAKKAKERGLSVVVYSGYTWQELMENKKDSLKILNYADYLIDGRFILEKKSYELRFKGSENQRIIDVKKSLESGVVVETDF